MADNTLQIAERQSIQDLPDAKKGDTGSFFWYATQRGYNLPQWGTRERERHLRLFYRHEYNWLGQSIFAALIKKVQSTPWEIKGKRKVSYFQDVLREAHFGAGWGYFISMVLLDFLRQDGGAYIEIIAPGNPLRPPTGAVTGIAHLDSLRCYPTGDPEYPVIYYSRKGKMHLLHRSRVVHLVDMPDGDDSNPGYGLCALSRAISIVTQEIHMNRYVESKLDDQPPPGYMVASNINEPSRNAALERYRQEQGGDQRPFWGRTVWLYSTDPTAPAKLEPVTFSQAPDSWSFKEYTELNVNKWAAAMNTDVQEIWQLTGGNIGSGAQSQILHAKSQGKMFGTLLTMLERCVNDVLPESLEYEFKRRDPQDEQERADNAGKWAGFTTQVKEETTPEERRRILANQVEAFKDAVTDEHGEIVRLDDLEDETDDSEQVADDATPQNTAAQTAAPPQTEDDAKAVKAIQSTRLDFEGDFEDLLTSARAKDISRRTFTARLRSMLAVYGEKAYMDGLADGGVDTMDTADSARYALLLVQQSKYVTGLGETLYTAGVSDAQAVVKPVMWFNKSIQPFYDAGLLSADRNGMYEFTGSDGAESCATCKRLKHQKHRFKWWYEKRLRPRVDTENFVCGGWQCEHVLVRVVKAA